MARITGKKTIFFVTSPRSPIKMIEEIKFLVENFSERKWGTDTQVEYYEALTKQPFFEGSQSTDPAFSARDRITRGPKSLGLVELKPLIKLTSAGQAFVYGTRSEEALLRQMLKFQLSSPYHVDTNASFSVKPYLELMRFVNDLNGLTKTEIALFVMQLTNYKNYDLVKDKIEVFRDVAKENRRNQQVSYREFVGQRFEQEIKKLFYKEIDSGEISTRESDDNSLKTFIRTKQHNHLDYADAAIRYLRATGLFTFDPRSLRLSVMPERAADVSHILTTIPREPLFFKTEEKYKEYLFPSTTPALLTDNPNALIKSILDQSKDYASELLEKKSIEELKDIFSEVLTRNLDDILTEQRIKLRSYEEYDDIQETFDRISAADIADPSLFFEWNTWRAFEMIDNGLIVGNFRVDSNGAPLYTAPGNTPDIICKYADFETIIEVTLSSGQRQYEMEGESVSRHYGNYRRDNTKPVFAFFIAPKINAATVAHYFVLTKTEVQYYGGRSVIIPVSLENFRNLLQNAKNSQKRINSKDLKELFDELSGLSEKSTNEEEWYLSVSKKINSTFQN